MYFLSHLAGFQLLSSFTLSFQIYIFDRRFYNYANIGAGLCFLKMPIAGVSKKNYVLGLLYKGTAEQASPYIMLLAKGCSF